MILLGNGCALNFYLILTVYIGSNECNCFENHAKYENNKKEQLASDIFTNIINFSGFSNKSRTQIRKVRQKNRLTARASYRAGFTYWSGLFSKDFALTLKLELSIFFFMFLLYFEKIALSFTRLQILHDKF